MEKQYRDIEITEGLRLFNPRYGEGVVSMVAKNAGVMLIDYGENNLESHTSNAKDILLIDGDFWLSKSEYLNKINAYKEAGDRVKDKKFRIVEQWLVRGGKEFYNDIYQELSYQLEEEVDFFSFSKLRKSKKWKAVDQEKIKYFIPPVWYSFGIREIKEVDMNDKIIFYSTRKKPF